MAVLTRRRLLGGAAALGVAAATGGLTGCGSSVSISSDPNELVLWYWARSMNPKLLAAAAEQIPGTTRRLRSDVIGGTFDTRLRTSLAGDAYIPDITAINSNCSLYFPNEDLFVDLNQYGAAEAKPDYFDWKWALGTAPSGRQMFWPMDTGPTGLYYRADVFQKAGLPSSPDEVGAAMRTWDNFIELGRKLRTDGNAALDITANTIFTQYLNASTERYFDTSNRPLFENEGSAVKQAWDTAVTAAQAKVTANAQTATDQNAGWSSGQIAGHVEAVWWAEILKDTAPDTKGKWRLASQPVKPGNSGGSFLCVPSTAKDPAAAVDFIRWAMNPQNQADTFNQIQLFPSCPASFTAQTMKSATGFFGDQDPLTFFSEAAKEVPTTFISTYESQVGAFSTEIANVESAGKNPDQAWQDAVDQTNRILKKRGVI
ncbi:ABC transporter substrate-binding protein [uncultured Friedmanniella sp.]|uniref:ABC transporter substrate-binding protein n=1 Tax=uncultured Friedmanniella sp. TaxID=335381 RepID=UPI0035CC7B48